MTTVGAELSRAAVSNEGIAGHAQEKNRQHGDQQQCNADHFIAMNLNGSRHLYYFKPRRAVNQNLKDRGEYCTCSVAE